MSVAEDIQRLVTENEVVLFMKGKRRMPQCGFSAKVVAILDELIPSYKTINVLESPEMREGIKAFSNWPTIPQLYVKGTFVGGCDIVTEMFEGGSLHETLGVPFVEAAPPSITVTAAAAEALKSALAAESATHVRLLVGADFRPGLDLDQAKDGDFVLDPGGVPLVVDRSSARRADGVQIDFVAGEQGGFRIENPNEPARVKQIGVKELKARMDAGEVHLFDVRTPEEQATARIDGARPLDAETDAFIQGLDQDTPLYFHCHHGGRSQQAAEHYLARGFQKVFNVAGGIDAWSQEVDPNVPRY